MREVREPMLFAHWVARFVIGGACMLAVAVAAGAGPEIAPGADDWMLPPCTRPISVAFPTRPPGCNGDAPYPAAAAATASPTSAAAAGNHPPAVPVRVSAAPDQVKVVKFARFRTSIRDGERVGEIKAGAFCNVSVPLNMGTRTEPIALAPVQRPLRDEFVQAGYHDPSRGRGLFEEDADQGRVDLQLGGMLEEMSVSFCSTAAGARIEGSARFRVRWELFDPAARKVVYSKSTEGQYRTQGTENIRETEFFGKAYREAIRQLLADQQFHDLVAGTAAAPTLAESVKQSDGAPLLKRVARFAGPLTENMTAVRSAVVTITRAGGSGSGFFVGEDGFVLTNSHVVAGQRFVRVRLATGRELVGEVLKQDTGRDVALIKTEGRGFIALPTHVGEVNVGSEVTAIGSPLGEALSGTVTRGIVSGYRNENSRRFIQSDVSILPGSSGGPLLDNTGRVVGIAVSGRAQGLARINFFVPISEALETLDLRFVD